MYLYLMYDRLAKKASGVFEATNDDAALRGFKIRLEGIPEIARGDFDLNHIGEFDESVGRMINNTSYIVRESDALEAGLEAKDA